MNLAVRDVERIPVRLEFRPVPARNMIRELPHWTLFEICRVTLECGIRGFGETMQYYTWGTVSDESVAQVIGRPAPEVMWDDTLGAGLQMALFDAVGRACETPVWSLLGRKCRDRTRLSWWAIDMPGSDWILECRSAMEAGYTDFKTKARPWFDVVRDCRQLCDTLPAWFDVDLDFNAMLVHAGDARRLLRRLGEFPQVKLFESPIPQGDVEGNRLLRDSTHVAIAHHYGAPPPETALREGVCDGFVIGGGASRVLADGAAAAAFNKPFFLQLVGSSITAAWSLHFGAVLSHARWPAVNCHQLYTESTLSGGIEVFNGSAEAPQAPGLGFDLDEDLIERCRLPEMPPKPYPYPDLLIAIRWAGGATSYYTHCMQYWVDFLEGRLPVFQDEVNLELVADDGSVAWRNLRDRAVREAVHDPGRPL